MQQLLKYHNAVYREAYLVPEVAQLKSYLEMSDANKGRELAEYDTQAFIKYLKDQGEESVVESVVNGNEIDYDLLEKYLQVAQPAMLEEFTRMGQLVPAGVDAPSWLFLSSPKLLKNQWLIHFTKAENLSSIEKNGFQFGQWDYARLGLTTYQKHTAPGFNFAFTLDNYWSYRPGYGDGGEWKYGNACVLFKASGIVAYHNGDEERQAIFWGPSAKDIVGLVQDGTEWLLDPCYYQKRFHDIRFADLHKATEWIQTNYRQYRKILSCR